MTFVWAWVRELGRGRTRPIAESVVSFVESDMPFGSSGVY